jgi:hypothetical protein
VYNLDSTLFSLEHVPGNHAVGGRILLSSPTEHLIRVVVTDVQLRLVAKLLLVLLLLKADQPLARQIEDLRIVLHLISVGRRVGSIFGRSVGATGFPRIRVSLLLLILSLGHNVRARLTLVSGIRHSTARGVLFSLTATRQMPLLVVGLLLVLSHYELLLRWKLRLTDRASSVLCKRRRTNRCNKQFAFSATTCSCILLQHRLLLELGVGTLSHLLLC